MDRFGNMAMGYSVSSSATFPEIRIAGRLPNDPLGQMSEATILEPGFGVQLRTVAFEDYSQMTLDPLDDCTFWYTGTYQPANSFNSGQMGDGTPFFWGTKVGSLRFPNCVADLSITKTRSPSGAISAGTNVTYTVTAKNNGPADAGNVTVPDTLVSGTGFVSLTPPAGWTCTTPASGQSGLINCQTTSLASGASAVFTSVASVSCSTPNGTVISDTASVGAQTPPDNNQSNNSQTVSFTVSNPVPVVNAAVALSLLPQNNHDLVNVGLTATATDGSCPTTFQVRVFGNEDDVTPTAQFSPDARDIAVGTLRLREERDATGNGRVYLVVVKATNAAKETGFATVTVVVPESSSPADISSVEMQAAAAKAFADTHNGAPPPGYFVIGDGPVIGPKQ
jgi:uncharacterized repeat protein (TIGR01451 family)